MFFCTIFNNLAFGIGNMFAFSERSSSLGLGAFHGVVGIDFGELTIPSLIVKSAFLCSHCVAFNFATLREHLVFQLDLQIRKAYPT